MIPSAGWHICGSSPRGPRGSSLRLSPSRSRARRATTTAARAARPAPARARRRVDRQAPAEGPEAALEGKADRAESRSPSTPRHAKRPPTRRAMSAATSGPLSPTNVWSTFTRRRRRQQRRGRRRRGGDKKWQHGGKGHRPGHEPRHAVFALGERAQVDGLVPRLRPEQRQDSHRPRPRGATTSLPRAFTSPFNAIETPRRAAHRRTGPVHGARLPTNGALLTNDASLLLPSTAMTGNYRVTGMPTWVVPMTDPPNNYYPPYVAITGLTDGTTVTVKLSSTGSVAGGAGSRDGAPSARGGRGPSRERRGSPHATAPVQPSRGSLARHAE